MSQTFEDGGLVNMGSMFNTPDEIAAIHKKHMAFYHATPADIVLGGLETPPSWDKLKANYKLHVKTYRGWKVYQLHTGAFAALTKYEDDFRREELAAGRE